MNSFNREPTKLKKKIINSFKNIYKSGWWVLGKNVNKFEKKWAKTIVLPSIIICRPASSKINKVSTTTNKSGMCQQTCHMCNS